MKYKKGNILKHYCQNCSGERNHKILNVIDFNCVEKMHSVSNAYMIMQCCGCDYVSFRHEYINRNFTLNGNAPSILCYPIIKKYVSHIERIRYVPRTIRRLYIETIRALNDECWTLAAAGFRSIIEAICLEKSIVGRTLDKKINSLKNNGIITKQDRDRLHSIRFMGNDSLHEMKIPNEESLSICLKIIDSILTNLYVIDRVIDGILLEPIKDYKSFEKILNEGICRRSIGDVVTVKDFVEGLKNIIEEDLMDFERKLVDKIKSGEYNKMELGPGGKGKYLKFKIISIDTE